MTHNESRRKPFKQRLSLHPLKLEEAVKAAMETGSPPKRDKPKKQTVPRKKKVRKRG